MARRIVLCTCPPKGAARRYAERAVTTLTVHVVRELTAEVLAQYDRPLGQGPVTTVDTTRPTDAPALAAQVRRMSEQATTRP